MLKDDLFILGHARFRELGTASETGGSDTYRSLPVGRAAPSATDEAEVPCVLDKARAGFDIIVSLPVFSVTSSNRPAPIRSPAILRNDIARPGASGLFVLLPAKRAVRCRWCLEESRARRRILIVLPEAPNS